MRYSSDRFVIVHLADKDEVAALLAAGFWAITGTEGVGTPALRLKAKRDLIVKDERRSSIVFSKALSCYESIHKSMCEPLNFE